jgi:hypothetical protein
MTKHWPSDRVGKSMMKCPDCKAWYKFNRSHVCNSLVRELIKFAKRKKGVR